MLRTVIGFMCLALLVAVPVLSLLLDRPGLASVAALLALLLYLCLEIF